MLLGNHCQWRWCWSSTLIAHTQALRINDKSILIVLNHNRCLYVVSQRWLLLLEKDFDKIDKKKNLLDTADDG